MTTSFVNLRHDTTAGWSSVNPILNSGEPGVEIVSVGAISAFRLKVGDGVTRWNSLAYASTSAGASAYQIAVAHGFVGTEAQWLASLKGATGSAGTSITIKGSVATSGDLPGSGVAGDGWIVLANGHLWVWSDSIPGWDDVGPIQGPQGLQGNPGLPCSLTIGTVSTGEPGSFASASITGAAPNQTLNITIPKGAPGATGTGTPGAAGPPNSLAIGTVTSSTTPSATITGTAPNQTLNLVLQKGDKGDTGAAGTGGDPTLSGTYGADNTGASDCTSALAAARVAGVKRMRVPAGTYRFNSKILIDWELELYGDGPNSTFLDSYTTTDHGMELAPTSSGVRLKLRDFTLRYKGAGQPAGKHGLVVKRKPFVDNIIVQDFTNDGIYFDTYTAGNLGTAVFFSRWTNVRSTHNGRDGWAIRAGANANNFENIQGDNNGRYGIHHYTDSANGGGATYANNFKGGQASYNKFQGWMMESGTDIGLDGIYAEYNCSPDNTNTNGYTQTALSTTDRRADFWFGDGVDRVQARLSAVLNNDSTHVRVPTASNAVSARIDVSAGLVRYTPLASAVSTSSATTIAQLVSDHNALVNALKATKVIG